jgi:N-acetyl-anhydromuramyl-L-alanine amidase AmpD
MVNDWHKKKWNYPASNGSYCGYHYFIRKDGWITTATPEQEEGMHTIGKNLESIGICLAGNFDATLPTLAQETSLRAILARLVSKYGLTVEQIYPHRQFAVKTCYGRKLESSWAKNLLKENALPAVEIPATSEEEKIKELKKQQISLLKKLVELLQKLLRLK